MKQATLPTILLTRPERAAVSLADDLRSRLGCGAPIVISPIMKIEWRDALPDLSGVAALIFTSRNGVDGFTRLSDRRDLPAYAVGPSTLDAASQAGFDAKLAGGTADALVDHLIAEGTIGPCLHIRGAHVSGQVAERLREAGIPTDEAVLYDQIACPLSAEAEACLKNDDPVILPIFSPRSAQLIFDNLQSRAPLFVAAISENAAQNIPKEAIKQLLVAEKPNAEVMLVAIERLYDTAKRLEGANRAQ